MKTEKYRANHTGTITKYEVVKETEKQIIFINVWGKDQKREDREAKSSNYHAWFDAFEDAKQYLIDRQKSHIESYMNSIKSCEHRIAKIESLTP